MKLGPKSGMRKESGGPGEPDKGEDIDLQGFGLQIPGTKE